MTLWWRLKFAVFFCIVYFALVAGLAHFVTIPSQLLGVVLVVICALVSVVLGGLLAAQTTRPEKPDVSLKAILTMLLYVPGVEVNASLVVHQLNILPQGRNTVPPKAWLQGLPMSHPLSQSVKSLILECSSEDLSKFIPAKIQERQIAISDLLEQLRNADE